MSVREKIDELIRDHIERYGHTPDRIILGRAAMSDFAHELGRSIWPPFSAVVPTCPNCGQSLLTYAGLPVELADEDTVAVGVIYG